MKIEDICIPTMEDLRKIARENKVQLKDVSKLAGVQPIVFYSRNPTYKTLVKLSDALKQILFLVNR